MSAVSGKAVVLLIALLVVAAVLVVVASNVWLSAPRGQTSCPVHVPGQTPWPGVPPQCIAGWNG